MTVGFSQGKQQNFQLETVSMGQWNDYSLFDDDDFDEVKGDYDDFFFSQFACFIVPVKNVPMRSPDSFTRGKPAAPESRYPAYYC